MINQGEMRNIRSGALESAYLELERSARHTSKIERTECRRFVGSMLALSGDKVLSICSADDFKTICSGIFSNTLKCVRNLGVAGMRKHSRNA